MRQYVMVMLPLLVLVFAVIYSISGLSETSILDTNMPLTEAFLDHKFGNHTTSNTLTTEPLSSHPTTTTPLSTPLNSTEPPSTPLNSTEPLSTPLNTTTLISTPLNTTEESKSTPLSQYTHLNPNPTQVDLSHIYINMGKQVGRGGYSRVFLGKRLTAPNTATLISEDPVTAAHDANDFDLAVKLIHKARYFRESQDPTSKKSSNTNVDALTSSIWSERDAWTAFSSPPIPHILPLRHILQDDHALYYISPLVMGADMDLVISKFGPLSESTVRVFAASLISALEGIHTRGYVYKDFKLKNMLLDENGDLRLIDFGLSRKPVPGDDVNCVTQGLRGRAGTKSYKSPEVLDGKGHSYPSDFYSLGVVLYKMLSGHKLYHTEDDSPYLRYQPLIPKYHTFKFKQPRWKSFNSLDLFTQYQQRLENSTKPHVDVRDHNVQRNITSAAIHDFIQKAKKTLNLYPQTGNSTDPKENRVYTDNQLFADGMGPIFIPDNRTDANLNSNLPHHDGVVPTPFAWLSLSDDCVDFLNQLVELNPFYRLGTANRMVYGQDDSRPSTTDTNQEVKEIGVLEVSSDEESSSYTDTSSSSDPNDPLSVHHHDFAHTQVGLLDPSKQFLYYRNVIPITVSGNHGNHCFPQVTNTSLPLPSFKGKEEIVIKTVDASGQPSITTKKQWKGLHSGFVEIKNHPFFKDFDWDTLTDHSPGSQLYLTREEREVARRFDIRNTPQRFPNMIPPHEDTDWDTEKFQFLFKDIEFNTQVGQEIV